METAKPPNYVQLKRPNGKKGAWHWVKLIEATRTTFWLITGCGSGLYANDKEVAEAKRGGTAMIEMNLCGRCLASRIAFYRRRGRKSKSRLV